MLSWKNKNNEKQEQAGKAGLFFVYCCQSMYLKENKKDVNNNRGCIRHRV